MDRRRATRYGTPGARISCTSAEYGDFYNFARELVDLSTGGACITTVGCLRPSVRLVVEIYLPEGLGRIRSRARVRWSRVVEGGCQSGLEFVGLQELQGRGLKSWFRASRLCNL